MHKLIRIHSSTERSHRIDHIFQQECIPVGCVPSAAVAVCWGGGLPRGVRPGGICPRGGGGSAQGWCLADTPRWTEFLTHASENIAFPQLRLRTIISNRQRIIVGLCLAPRYCKIIENNPS